jgi:hypothetical protein
MNEDIEISYGEVVRRLPSFETMRVAIAEMDERLVGEITRIVWRTATAMGWKYGFEAENIERWWIAPLNWRRTIDTPLCQYDFELFFYLTLSGDNNGYDWPLTDSIIGHLAGVNGARFVVRCHIYRLRTKTFVELLQKRKDILQPLTSVGWELDPHSGYLELPIYFNVAKLAERFDKFDIEEAILPIQLALEGIAATIDMLFAPLMAEIMNVLQNRSSKIETPI